MMKIVKNILAFALIALTINTQAQRSESFAERLRFGGNFSAQFGDVTFVDISPTVGYMATDRYMVGVGGRYQYYSDRIYNFKWNMYGASVFNRYFLSPSFYAHAEYEALNLPYIDPFSSDEKRRWVGSAMAGGGIIQPFGSEYNRSYLSIQALYILNYDAQTSPYTQPWVFRIGIIF